MSLPIGPVFGQIDRVIDGKKYVVPTMPALACFFSEPNDIMSVRAEDGHWMLGCYADGRWFRRRMNI